MKFLIFLLEIYSYLILVEVVLSWVGPQASNQFTDFIQKTTEPVLGTLRKVIPPIGNIDLSPFVAFILIRFIMRVLADIG